MKYLCPVCGYPDLDEKPANHEICPSCGTLFGYDDYLRSHADLRQEWLDNDAKWFLTGFEPYGWNAYEQLRRARFIDIKTNSATNTTTNVKVFNNTYQANLPRYYENVKLDVRLIDVGILGIGCITVRDI